MAEENQVQQKPQQVTKEPQQEQQRVTTKDPQKVEAGKRLAAINHKKREAKKERRTSTIGEDLRAGLHQQSKPILWNWGRYSCGSDRWPWLLHLSKQERRSHHQAGHKHQHQWRATFKPTTK